MWQNPVMRHIWRVVKKRLQLYSKSGWWPSHLLQEHRSEASAARTENLFFFFCSCSLLSILYTNAAKNSFLTFFNWAVVQAWWTLLSTGSHFSVQTLDKLLGTCCAVLMNTIANDMQRRILFKNKIYWKKLGSSVFLNLTCNKSVNFVYISTD